ncbi:hypothetical protein [Desulfotomaculum sp. 1211_IL3151]|uniref:hypothetical protein n=1 Tax=Desulfotomaculum sp. 1211_IL3151 TaxID=3084055 RepID=UPI002FD9D45C
MSSTRHQQPKSKFQITKQYIKKEIDEYGVEWTDLIAEYSVTLNPKKSVNKSSEAITLEENQKTGSL